MQSKIFECPYLTVEDKEFLEREYKIYEECAKAIILLYQKHKDRRKSDYNDSEDYLKYDICCYFSRTRDIKELNSDEHTMEEVINETEMLTLDEVFNKYILKYLKK